MFVTPAICYVYDITHGNIILYTTQLTWIAADSFNTYFLYLNDARSAGNFFVYGSLHALCFLVSSELLVWLK